MLVGDIKEVIEAGRYPVISSNGTTGRTETRFAGVRHGKCFAAIKAFIFVKAQFSSAAGKDFVNVPRDGVADTVRIFFVETLPVVVIFKDVFNGNIAGDSLHD